MNENFLVTEGLAVGYDRKILISDICLNIRKGEILVLIGPNGAGKSTILKTIIRRLAPLGGTVFLSGADLAGMKDGERAKRIASVQPGRTDAELMTVEDVVSMGRYPYTGTFGLLSQTDRAAVAEVMRRLRIETLADCAFDRLSDGQRQRVLLARALVQEPELLVLDEPTTFLDIRCQLEFLTILKALAKEKQLTIVLSLHELELAKKLADRVVCVSASGITAFGTPKEIFVPERIEPLFGLEPGAYREYTGDSGTEEHYIFSDGKRMRCGFTTGTCAALATQACLIRLLTGVWPETVSLRTPKGWNVRVAPEMCTTEGETARCAVRKDAGDDADRTDGILIFADVTLTDGRGVTIDGGTGVGRVTKPGLDRPVGEAAINSVPRRMILEVCENAFRSAEYAGGAAVVISAPEGTEIAAHTFNPMLGIEGGISILGTSGIVEPMSMQALIGTIEVELKQARAQGAGSVILTPGNYGFDFLKSNNVAPRDVPVVRCSNFIGDALDLCGALGFSDVLLVGHAGKLVKLAGGIMNTHSRFADCRTELFCAHAAVCGADAALCARLLNCATSDACIEELDHAGMREAVMQSLNGAIQRHLEHRADGRFRVGALLFSNVYGELGRTGIAKDLPGCLAD